MSGFSKAVIAAAAAKRRIFRVLPVRLDAANGGTFPKQTLVTNAAKNLEEPTAEVSGFRCERTQNPFCCEAVEI